MEIHIAAIGRMKAGPERALFEHYKKRLEDIGHSNGISAVHLREFAEGTGRATAERKKKEAVVLLKAIPQDAMIVALDENGSVLSSKKFAGEIGRWRDDGMRHLVFVLGGADGLDVQLVKQAGRVISLGRMTWPHQIARILLCEQLYRAMAIITGHPYHRS